MAAREGLAEAARSGVHALIATLGATGAQLQMRNNTTTSLLPVAVRRSTDTVRLLVPADVLEAALSVSGNIAITVAMQAVAQVIVDGETFIFSGTEELDVAGGVCLYRLLLQEAGKP